ncbi:MAG: SUMF1/EgtB/PvdO family nonheme iron enzyme [Candidatus Brocadiae bacterium]|nr:SUMF1/EgtB/PvdO family nonheme iron enzyme [Candidatus Brocadiia bacterium]
MERLPFHRGDKIRDSILGDIVSVGPLGVVYQIVDKPYLLKAPYIDSSKMLREKFCKEVSFLKNLSHPGILGIFDCDLESAIPWCRIPLPPWKTLRYRLKAERPIPVLQALCWMYSISDTLGAMHTKPEQILHERLRPEQIAFQEDKPVLLDLALGDFGSVSGISLAPQADFLYLAPEQLDIKSRMDTKAQVYTLGIIFYEILSGNPPYGSVDETYYDENRTLFIDKILSPQVPVPPIRELPKPLPKILQKALHKDKKLRYNDAQEMSQDLQKALKEMLMQEAKKYKEEGNLAKAVSLAKQALDYSIQDSYFEELHSMRSLLPKEEKIEKQPVEIPFCSHLKEALSLLKSEENKETLYHKLGIQNQPDFWENLFLDIKLLEKSMQNIAPYIPHPIEEEKIQIIETPKALISSKEEDYALSDSEAMFFEELPKEESLSLLEPQIYKPKVVPEETVDLKEMDIQDLPQAEDEIQDLPQVKEEIPERTIAQESEECFFEDISESFIRTEEMPALSEERPVVVLAKGFQWLDNNTILCEKDNSQMVYIPAGTFIMGCQAMYAFDVEKPEHEVYLDEYFIDKYPITWEQYLKFCQEKKHPQPKAPAWGIIPDHPVVNISWQDAKEYCEWSGKLIPTEAQWEKSARGGIWLDGDFARQRKNSKPQRIYPWGDDSIKASGAWKANCSEEPVYGKNKGSKSTSPVGHFSMGQSPYGVSDLAGNVWEWTSDWFSSEYYKNSPLKNPTGPENGETRDNDPSGPGKVLRGGSWYVGSRFLRTSVRRKRSCEERGASCGMRCVAIFPSSFMEKKK